MIGVQLLSQLTCEMNQISEVEANRSLTKHRKIASSFEIHSYLRYFDCPAHCWVMLGRTVRALILMMKVSMV